ncbi:peptidoglycan-binding protein [Photobacterium frigidiphilum]|uniref:Peptidoglycan-binding protein n=1 Tax=Photobacterium frigidiphilum TaxID=264736 RepID=A0A2T3JCQ0_9GAMM|nr:putative peptidoglycan-binding domain-containing protein [Photobacterium frigidiphilum]PSU46650.1 peptidoglycan-binding protein [Photobacterium frigidiphilum]
MPFKYPFSTKGYTPQFCHAVHFILEKEGGLRADGGYVNDPKDPGGETKYGISKRAFLGVDIATLDIDRAVRIYYTNYWKAAYCHEFAGNVALYQMDSAVQHGAITAIKLLQEIAGTKADGKMGPNTRTAVHGSDAEWLVSRYGLRRARYYARILKNNYSQTRYIEGWHNRLADLTDAAWELAA